MKKKMFSLLAVVLFTVSLISSASSKELVEPTRNYEDSASCFEQGHYYSLWWQSVTGCSAFEALEVCLAYTATCEKQNSLQLHHI